jgi:hypothetical protein
VYRCDEHETRKKPLINVVVFLQKEALPLHFFLGKMELFKLEPTPPDKLVSYYKDRFKTFEPFTEEALLEIAYCSRGIFRRFKQYVSACIEEEVKGYGAALFPLSIEKQITLEDVKKTITVEKISQDMELELSEIYPRSAENRVFSVKVIRFLRENGLTSQKVLTKELFNNDKLICSRILNALCMHEKIEFHDDGREKIWKIRETRSH